MRTKHCPDCNQDVPIYRWNKKDDTICGYCSYHKLSCSIMNEPYIPYKESNKEGDKQCV